ncbi:MAG: site-2 protease family protein [Planctomycetes bacterium]|nr:site-2 protease family protein [Planctomycetota bacterium]
MTINTHLVIVLAAFAVLVVAFFLLRRIFRKRRVEVNDNGLVVDRMFAFGWRDIKRLDFWIERGIARYVVYLGASRYAFSHPEATMDDPLKLKHTIIEKSKLEREPVPGPIRIETFVRHGETRSLPLSLLEAAGKPSRSSLVAAIVGGLMLWASKAKWLTSLLTLAASVGAYHLLGTWTFAMGVFGVVLIHELGHGWVMRAHGLRAGFPIFIPFVGAIIAMRDQPRDARVEAEIGYGGPLTGAIASTIAFVVFYATQSDVWLRVALVGYLLNLFQMIPVLPLDGGRIVAAISPRLWIVGIAFLAAVVGLTWASPSPRAEYLPGTILLLMLASIGMGRAWEAWRDPRRLGPEAYYDVPGNYRIAMALAYLLLTAFLTWMTYTCLSLGR